jgi:hypothetical protein
MLRQLLLQPASVVYRFLLRSLITPVGVAGAEAIRVAEAGIRAAGVTAASVEVMVVIRVQQLRIMAAGSMAPDLEQQIPARDGISRTPLITPASTREMRILRIIPVSTRRLPTGIRLRLTSTTTLA